MRQQRQPKLVRDIAWKAQLRLTQRFRKLDFGRKMKITKVCVAIARELCGFIWDLARHPRIVFLVRSRLIKAAK